MESKILLENGTNELEVLEFKIDDHCYGINVAKIKEIIVYEEVTPVPNAHPSIEGIFIPRDTMITAIDKKQEANSLLLKYAPRRRSGITSKARNKLLIVSSTKKMLYSCTILFK